MQSTFTSNAHAAVLNNKKGGGEERENAMALWQQSSLALAAKVTKPVLTWDPHAQEDGFPEGQQVLARWHSVPSPSNIRDN